MTSPAEETCPQDRGKLALALLERLRQIGCHACNDKLYFEETESVTAEQPDEQNVGRW